MTIGIFGGTFDPVHHGHLAAAKALLEALPLEAIHFMPCHQPVHRQMPKASAQDRLAMLELAIADQPQLAIETCELDRRMPSYTIDSLQILKQHHPNTSFALIIGADAFSQFETWKQYQDILNHCHLIIMDRAAHPLKRSENLEKLFVSHETQDPAVLKRQSSGAIYRFAWPSPDISSTQIRDELRNRKSTTHILPKAVANYIQTQHLYVD